MSVYMCMRRHACACVEEETFASQFSPSTMWMLGIKIRLSGLAASAFSHVVISLAKILLILSLITGHGCMLFKFLFTLYMLYTLLRYSLPFKKYAKQNTKFFKNM